MGEHDRVDWTVSDAPPPDDALSAKPEQKVIEPPRMLPSRRLSRRAWLFLAAFIILAVSLAAALPRLEAWRTRQAVESVISRQEQARLAGDWAVLRSTYSRDAGAFADAEVLRDQSDWLYPPLGLPGAWLDRQAGRMGQFQMLTSQLVRADVIRSFSLGDGTSVSFGLPQFHQFISGAWRQVPAPAADLGQRLTLDTARIHLVYYPTDAGQAVTLGNDLDQLAARACADWNCPADLRVIVRFDPSADARPINPGLVPSLFGSLTFQTIAATSGPWSWHQVSLPTRQEGVYPADPAATNLMRRIAGVQALIVIAEQLAPRLGPRDGSAYIDALVVREAVRLGLEAPGLAHVQIANTLVDPELLWSLGDFGLPQALAIMNQVLADRGVADEARLMHAFALAPHAQPWLAEGLGLTPAGAQALLAAALDPPFPAVQQPNFVPDLALSCPAGPMLAALSGQAATLLAGEFPDSVAGAWSPSGAQLALAVSGRWGVVDVGGNAPLTGRWLPAVATDRPGPTWATDTVLVYSPASLDAALQQISPTDPVLAFFDAAQPAHALNTIPGYGLYVPSPAHDQAVLSGQGFVGTGMIVIPALGGALQSSSVVLTATWGSETSGLNPSWSPDGKRLAYSNFDKTYLWLYLTDMSGAASHRLLTTGDPGVPLMPIHGTLVDVIPSWSPAGDRLALVVDLRDQFPLDGWVGLIKPDGTDFQVLAPAMAYAAPTVAALSADGRFLAVGVANISGPEGVALYAVADGNRLRLVPDAALAGWSPSGHILAVTDAEGVSVLREPGNLSVAPEAFGPPGCTGVAWRPK